MIETDKQPSAWSPDTEPKGSISIDCVVNGPIETNTYLVRSGDELVIIDPAWDGEALARHIASQHPDARAAAIVCTHGHGDHVGGVAGLHRSLGSDVPYLLSEGDVDTVGPSIARQRAAWGILTEDPGAPSRLLSEGDAIGFGDACLQVIATPGHTPGGIVLFTAATTGNVAFVGDTLFPGSHGRTDLEGGDEAAVIRSLGKLGSILPADTLCLIGHGPSTTIADERASNPFMRRSLARL